MIDRQHASLRTLGRTAALAALLALAAPAGADIYSFVEEDGTFRFSNQPDDPRYKLYLRDPAEYKLREAKEFLNLRNPGDYRLRATLGKRADLLANPLL